MKTASLLTVLLFSALTFAQSTEPSSAPYCYGNGNVDQEKPFIVSVSGLSAKKAKALAKNIQHNEILTLGLAINLGGGSLIYEVGADISKIAVAQQIGLDFNQAVNEIAYTEILTTVSKYQSDSSQVVVQCNEMATAYPAAGGIN
jgi:hypothetical protein